MDAFSEQPLTRELLAALAQERLREAEVLLAAACWSGAYYLAGYAVELGLKACFARRFAAHVIPDARLVRQIHTHKLIDLCALAGLSAEVATRSAASQRFNGNWTIAAEWSEQTQYRRVGEGEARALLEDLVDHQDGMATWISTRW